MANEDDDNGSLLAARAFSDDPDRDDMLYLIAMTGDFARMLAPMIFVQRQLFKAVTAPEGFDRAATERMLQSVEKMLVNHAEGIDREVAHGAKRDKGNG